MKALPVDPVKKIVSASTGRLVVMSRTPQPCASVTLPFSTMAIGDAGHAECLAKLLDALLEPGRRGGRRGRSEQSRGNGRVTAKLEHEQLLGFERMIRVCAAVRRGR